MSGWSEPLYVTSGKTPGGQRRNFQTKGLGSVVVFLLNWKCSVQIYKSVFLLHTFKEICY